MVKAFYLPEDRRLAGTLRTITRSVEDSQRPTGTERDRTLLKVQDAVDKISAQSQALAEAVDELQARATHQVAPAALTLTYGTGYGQKGPANRNFTLPAPAGARRTATLIGSGIFEWAGGTAPASLGIYLRLELWQGSKLVAADVANVSNNPFVPATFNGDSFSVTASLRVPSGASPAFQLRLYGYRSSDGGTSTDAGRVANLSFTLSYGDKY